MWSFVLMMLPIEDESNPLKSVGLIILVIIVLLFFIRPIKKLGAKINIDFTKILRMFKFEISFSKPKWNNSNPKIREEFFQNTINEKLLLKIALQSNYQDSKEMAVKLMNDEINLGKVIIQGQNESLSKFAISRIKKVDILKSLAKSWEIPVPLRRLIFQKINNDKILQDCILDDDFKNDEHEDTTAKKELIKCIKNKDILNEIALKWTGDDDEFGFIISKLDEKDLNSLLYETEHFKRIALILEYIDSPKLLKNLFGKIKSTINI